jgi:hypothetical protein
MVEKGQVNADEGARLLGAAGAVSVKGTAESSAPSPRWFHVRVTDLHTGKGKVNVNVPMSLIHAGMRMGAKVAPEVAGIGFDELVAAVQEGTSGKIIDVEDEEEGEHVEIYVD